MADKELWQIELDLKLDKFNAGEKAYSESFKRAEQLDKRFTAQKQSEVRLREKIITASLKEEQRATDQAYREKLAMAKQFDAAILEDRKRTNALLKAEQDKLSQPGPSTMLKGDIGSAAYVGQLKAIQRELSPTSAEYTKLAATIREYEAELNKVNKSSGLMAFKSLTVAIKETKGELAKLAAEQKTGTAEWQKYSDKLRELQRQKQLIQRETKLTSQQLIAMSRDLTVVAYGLRQIGTDISSLSDGKKSAGEMAMAIGGIGMQVLIVLPAIHGLTKALEAAGIVSASTIAKLAALSSTLGTLAGGIAIVSAAYGVMIGAVTNLESITGRLGAVLSGQVGIWEAIAINVKDVTFGLLDFTNASNSFDSSNVQQQLSDLAYIANFTANAFNDLKQSVDNALETNMEKFRRGGQPFFKEFTDEEFKQQQQELKRVNKPPSKKGGSPKAPKQTTDPIDAMLTGIANEVRFKELSKTLTMQFLDEQIKLIKAVDTENLKLEQKIALLEAIQQLRQNELYGIKNIPDPLGINTDAPGFNFKKGIKLPYINTPDMRPDMTSEEIAAMLKETELTFEQIKDVAGNIVTPFQNILELAGLTESSFGQILQMVQAVLNTGSGIFGAISTILNFIPGGSLIGGGISAIGGLSGGGLGSMTAGGSMPNIGMPNRSMGNMPTIIFNSEVEKTKSVRFYSNTLPEYERRQAVKAL